MPKKLYITKEVLEALLKEGHKVAFETIFKLYYDKLFHIAKGYMGRKEDAEEIVQNVFLKLWNNIDSLHQITNINGYLFTLTKNNCLDVLKHEKVKSKFIAQKKLTIQRQYVEDATESFLLEKELNDRIAEGIERLPEKCKKVFVQSRLEGLKNDEIAKMLNLSKRTVDNHISNGIRLMRVYLKEFTAFFLLLFL